MNSLAEIAPAFVDMARRIVWASVATVAPDGAPRSRILHPYWVWDGTDLVGWVGTANAGVKGRDLATNPMVSVSYWAGDDPGVGRPDVGGLSGAASRPRATARLSGDRVAQRRGRGIDLAYTAYSGSPG